MKIGIGQMNSIIGDFAGNVQKILEFSVAAWEEEADILVFPELSVCGYPPMDLLGHPVFLQENLNALRKLQQELPPTLAVVVGHIAVHSPSTGKALQNSSSVIFNGEIVHRQAKTLLPSYDVFDEARYFEPARCRNVWEFKGIRIGIAICEDIWWESEENFHYSEDPVRELLDQNIQMLLVPSASPFYSGKLDIRKKLIREISILGKIPVIYVNMVGANDNLIFDGRSLIANEQENFSVVGKGFQEDLIVHDLSISSSVVEKQEGKYAEVEPALHLGIRDYLAKTGFEAVHLGLSGGIDSALVLTLAVQALGPDRVRAFMLPGHYSSLGSISDSQKLCRNLGIIPDTIGIDPIYKKFEMALSSQFAGTQPGLAEENIQARIRGTLLMAYSNKFNSLLLSTGNKSELGVGYCTLYGDMAGSLAVIGDLFKTEVYELCHYINRYGNIIPAEILMKAPSAELRPNQKDQDSLPPYEILDKILELYFVEGHTELPDFDLQIVQEVIKLVIRAEHKRYQAPPVLKISPKAFGTGRRVPIARAIYEV